MKDKENEKEKERRGEERGRPKSDTFAPTHLESKESCFIKFGKQVILYLYNMHDLHLKKESCYGEHCGYAPNLACSLRVKSANPFF